MYQENEISRVDIAALLEFPLIAVMMTYYSPDQRQNLYIDPKNVRTYFNFPQHTEIRLFSNGIGRITRSKSYRSNVIIHRASTQIPKRCLVVDTAEENYGSTFCFLLHFACRRREHPFLNTLQQDENMHII